MRNLNWVMKACGIILLWAAAAVALSAQTLTTLYSFCSINTCPDGARPVDVLIQATDGNLYGTTYDGGNHGHGTIFEISPTGTLTELYKFCARRACLDGQHPSGGLVQATEGNFYGTTNTGGVNSEGTVFKITPGGALTTLYSFCSQSGCADGENPYGGLVQATDGNFYGTTHGGGANGSGTVFRVTASGSLTVLYSFCSQGGCADGENPYAGLVQATDGNLYGTTLNGGAHGGSATGGTVFKMTANGVLTTLYSFCSQSNCKDGGNPYARLIQADNGALYGTTAYGGVEGGYCPQDGCGTAFKITQSGLLTTLYTFCSISGCPDGENPYGGLVQATDRHFYGTTFEGGAGQNCGLAVCGTVFQINQTNEMKTLYEFCSQGACADGAQPLAGLVQGTDGKFYGTTSSRGGNNEGTIFSLSVGLGPFVETQPTSGKVGAPVKVLGTDLTGATGVTFNGISATFKVVSSSLITTTVPAGATSGTVQVVTPSSGTLSSNVIFRVRP